jgi:hypothetical protein
MMAKTDTAATRAVRLVGVTEFFQRSSSNGIFAAPNLPQQVVRSVTLSEKRR